MPNSGGFCIIDENKRFLMGDALGRPVKPAPCALGEKLTEARSPLEGLRQIAEAGGDQIPNSGGRKGDGMKGAEMRSVAQGASTRFLFLQILMQTERMQYSIQGQKSA